MPMHNDLLGQRVGERLRAARLNKDLSQKELGELIGTSKQQIFKYENATDIPSLSRLIQLSEALNIPPASFLDDHLTPKAFPQHVDGRNILFHAYALLSRQNRILLLSIAEALLECSRADRVHRSGSDRTARSMEAIAGEVRDLAINQ